MMERQFSTVDGSSNDAVIPELSSAPVSTIASYHALQEQCTDAATALLTVRLASPLKQ